MPVEAPEGDEAPVLTAAPMPPRDDAPSPPSSPDDAGVDTAAPPSQPPPTFVRARLVFVTSLDYDVERIIGIAEADRICQRRAELGDARLAGRDFKAWLSSGRISPATRFSARTSTAAPYFRLDAVLVARDFGDLVDGSALNAAIAIDENGARQSGPVWTGTRADGASTGNDCNAWSAMFGAVGTVGTVTNVPGVWSAADVNAPCAARARLYCFEDGSLP
jgi:hypothetical protein